jgi:hypothetical protein
MTRYVLLGLATLSGLLGFGLLSCGILIALWISNRETAECDGLEDAHRIWVLNTAKVGVIGHLALIVILIVKVSLVARNNGDGWFATLVMHWLMDHVGEALISVWLGFRVLKGGINFRQKRVPSFVSASIEPSQ